MRLRILCCLLSLAPAALAGCATFSFKPGANPVSIAEDEASCRKAGDSDLAFRDCMRERGWFISGGTAATPTPTAAQPAAATSAATAVPAASPRAAGSPKQPQTAVPTAAAAVEAPAAAPAAPAAQPVAPAPAAPAAQPVAPAPAAAGGALPRIRVGSWWKLGGTASGLDAAISACVRKLGAPHQPDANATVVTEAMRDCLKQDGWYPYDVSPSP